MNILTGCWSEFWLCWTGLGESLTMSISSRESLICCQYTQRISAGSKMELVMLYYTVPSHHRAEAKNVRNAASKTASQPFVNI